VLNIFVEKRDTVLCLIESSRIPFPKDSFYLK